MNYDLRNKQLFDRYWNGDESAKAELIELNSGLIHKVLAGRKFNLDNDLEYADHYQNGIFGLNRAIEKFDPKKAKFSTYAFNWIKQSITRECGNTQYLVRIPVHLQGYGIDNPTKDFVDNLVGGEFEDSVIDSVYGQQKLEELSRRNKEIALKRFTFDYTFDEIAVEYDLTREAVRLICNKLK